MRRALVLPAVLLALATVGPVPAAGAQEPAAPTATPAATPTSTPAPPPSGGSQECPYLFGHHCEPEAGVPFEFGFGDERLPLTVADSWTLTRLEPGPFSQPSAVFDVAVRPALSLAARRPDHGPTPSPAACCPAAASRSPCSGSAPTAGAS